MKNKMILWGLIGFLVFVFFLIIYFRYLSGDDDTSSQIDKSNSNLNSNTNEPPTPSHAK